VAGWWSPRRTDTVRPGTPLSGGRRRAGSHPSRSRSALRCAICQREHAADAACQAPIAREGGGTVVSPPRATPAAPGLGNLVGRWLGEWLLVRLLGQGGMGAVYLSHGSIGQLVAVKVLHPALSRDAALVDR